MKTVFSNDMVAHVWAQQTQDFGRSSNHSFSFQGPTLYSYRTPIAVFTKGVKGQTVCLLTSNSYSMTTSSKHLPNARRSVPHDIPQFSVPNLVTGPYRDKANREAHKANLAVLVSAYTNMVGRYRRMLNYHGDCGVIASYLAGLAVTAERYARLFGLKAPRFDVSADADAIWAYRAEREARRNTSEHQAKLEKARKRRERKKEEKEERKRLAAYDDALNRFVRYMMHETHDEYSWAMVYAYEFPRDSFERRYLESAERERNLAEGREAYAQFCQWRYGVAPMPERLSSYVQWSDAERQIWKDAKDAADRAKLADAITDWRNGGIRDYRLYSLSSPLLRLRNDGLTVETSQGAEFPLAHALRAIPIILRCRANQTGWTTNGHSISLGHFTISEITANGDVRAGCHFVRFDEIASFVQTLRERGLYADTATDV